MTSKGVAPEVSKKKHPKLIKKKTKEKERSERTGPIKDEL